MGPGPGPPNPPPIGLEPGPDPGPKPENSGPEPLGPGPSGLGARGPNPPIEPGPGPGLPAPPIGGRIILGPVGPLFAPKAALDRRIVGGALLLKFAALVGAGMKPMPFCARYDANDCPLSENTSMP